jgi:hypothetical protein
MAQAACGGIVMMYFNSIINHIEEARREAMLRGIEANTVAINDKLYFSKLSNGCCDVPIVCGLKCVYTNELPDNTMFAVFEASNSIMTKDEIIADLQNKNRELHKQLERAYEIIGNMIDK